MAGAAEPGGRGLGGAGLGSARLGRAGGGPARARGVCGRWPGGGAAGRGAEPILEEGAGKEGKEGPGPAGGQSGRALAASRAEWAAAGSPPRRAPSAAGVNKGAEPGGGRKSLLKSRLRSLGQGGAPGRPRGGAPEALLDLAARRRGALPIVRGLFLLCVFFFYFFFS